MKIIMSLLILSTGLFETILSGNTNIIPSREEQANLLLNVQEVFEQVKFLVNIEGNRTDESVVTDIHKIVQRARDKLALIEELTVIKISHDANSVCMLDSRNQIEEIVRSSSNQLEGCIKKGHIDITENSRQLTNVTEFATERGQNLLDTLGSCSRKPGLHVISCYKNVIATDVVPVKQMILGAIDAHKVGHLRSIQIRNEANDCVDQVIDKFQTDMAKLLLQALQCK